jgi:hypothetical protein
MLEQLRASDFVIFEGTCKDKNGKTRDYSFAKIDNRCNLMNNTTFINNLKEQGARVITKQ